MDTYVISELFQAKLRVKIANRSEVIAAHHALSIDGKGVSELGELIDDGSECWFLLSDPDYNWWEITSAELPNLS
ncbi:MAG: hypothetical protein CL763_03340 [Chloroflexi bacterium]|nr:hypothetical protein [Chloroflexota bacterium]|tara:strand:+ start:8979 stop:9203 length:225 start_codon:yes stop_codon:yes gene_type:complete